jgi:hypothetical protein
MDCARSHLQKTTSPREENSPLFQFTAVAGFLLRLHSALVEYSQGLSSMGCLPGAGSCRNQAISLIEVNERKRLLTTDTSGLTVIGAQFSGI